MPKKIKKPEPNLSIFNSDESVRESILDCVEKFKEGYDLEEIKEYAVDQGYCGSSDTKYISNIKDYLKNQLKEYAETITSLHCDRYEYICSTHIDPNADHVPKHLRKQFLTNKLAIAIDSLVAKENLLGYHSKEFYLQINNINEEKTKDKMKESMDDYNFEKLPFDKQIKLKEYIDKCKQDEDEVQIIRPERNEEKKEEEYTDYQEIETSTLKSVKEDESKTNLKSNESNNLDDVKLKLRKSLEKKAKEKFEKIKNK